MTNLTFTQNADGFYEASFNATGEPQAVQMVRTTADAVTVFANVGTLAKTPVQGFSKYETGSNCIFTVNFPSGVKVTIVSNSQVTSAGYE